MNHTLRLENAANYTIIAYCTACGHNQQINRNQPQWGTTIETWWKQHLQNTAPPIPEYDTREPQ